VYSACARSGGAQGYRGSRCRQSGGPRPPGGGAVRMKTRPAPHPSSGSRVPAPRSGAGRPPGHSAGHHVWEPKLGANGPHDAPPALRKVASITRAAVASPALTRRPLTRSLAPTRKRERLATPSLKGLQLRGLLALVTAGALRYARNHEVPRWRRGLAMPAGNGILLDHHVGQARDRPGGYPHLVGTETMQALIVGSDITGLSASPNARWSGRPRGPGRACRSRHLDPGPC
jgi:hypothetical protein